MKMWIVRHPTARFLLFVLCTVQLIIVQNLQMLIALSTVIFFLAWKNGWQKSGGPAWWVVFLSFFLIVLIHCFQWYPTLSWKIGNFPKGVSVAIKLVGFLSVSVWFMGRLSPLQLITLFEKISSMFPFLKKKYLGISMGIAISVLPDLRNSFQTLRTAYLANYPENSNTGQKKFHFIQRILPAIFIQTLRRADEVSIALYCRGFRGYHNTVKHDEWTNFEKIMVITVFLITIVFFMLRKSS
ncbi:MAG: energy-coupling factor transporter transmembrane protein EcfT [bacterium]|nr:energy-coupling factor transporter transmembrane protein EcfT [bacterium]